MGALLKNAITRSVEAAATEASTLFLDESLARIPTIDAKEIRQLSRFLPVIVLIHKSTIKGMGGLAKHTTRGCSTDAEPNKLLGLFGQAVERFSGAGIERKFLIGDVTVNMDSMEAYRDGEPIVFTVLEFKTLKHFILNVGRVISRDELLNEVWGYDNYPCTRTVDNHVMKLRQKLERDPARPVHFRTVHGAGYKFLP
jgi:DNA-binding response OmpR family regulator